MPGANKRLREIRLAIRDVIKKIKQVDGYVTEFPDANIYPLWNQEFFDDLTPAKFPKGFVYLEDQSFQPEVASRTRREANFVVVLATIDGSAQAPPTSDDAQELVEDLIEDFARAMELNSKLGGCVVQAYASHVSTDGGIAFPEGVAVFNIRVMYDIQRPRVC